MAIKSYLLTVLLFFKKSNKPSQKNDWLSSLRDPYRQALMITKSKAIERIRSCLRNEYFIELATPTIVGECVSGPVTAFKVDFFGRVGYLTISNMLYHSILCSAGFHRFYEIGKIFRQNKTNRKQDLIEFEMLDICIAFEKRDTMMDLIKNIIFSVQSTVNKTLENSCLDVLANPTMEFTLFTFMQFQEMLESKGFYLSGKHKNRTTSDINKYLRKNLPYFYWIIDSPYLSKPFYDKKHTTDSRLCTSMELWYGDLQIAAGGERIDNRTEAETALNERSLELDNFQFYLKALETSPPSVGIGLGIDRLLSIFIKVDKIHDFVPFPRTYKTLVP